MNRSALTYLLTLLLASQTSVVTAAEFVRIGEGLNLIVNGISADGNVVVGRAWDENFDSEAFMWTRDEGVKMMGFLPGHTDSSAVDLSADGSMLVGTSWNNEEGELFLWGDEDGMTGLGQLPGYRQIGTTPSISDDGSTIVGTAFTGSPAFDSRGFRWTEEHGFVSLLPPGMIRSRAEGVSSDGSVIGVHGRSDLQSEDWDGFLWTGQDGFQTLGPEPNSWTITGPRLVSADGSVVFGNEAPSGARGNPFRWTAEDGIQRLPIVPGSGDVKGSVEDITPDGSLAIGDFQRDVYKAFMWDEQNGTRDLRNVLLSEHGFAEDDLPLLSSARAISADATIVVGYDRVGDLREAWAIYLDKPLVSFGLDGDYNNNGQVEQADLDLVLLHWGADATAVPDSWANDLATGTIDQNELDGVLLNWGSTSAAIGAASVPEPGSLALLATCVLLVIGLVPRTQLRLVSVVFITAIFTSISPLTAAEFVEIGAEMVARSISADGRLVAGYTSGDDKEAYIWSRESGVRLLGALPGHVGSRASDISADGSVVLGISWGGNQQQPFLWTKDHGITGLGTLAGFDRASLSASISDDGSTVVGNALKNLQFEWQSRAFRWTEEAGMIGLLPAGATESRADDVSADGSVIVGSFNVDGDAGDAFIWDEENGFRTLGARPPDWTHTQPRLISDDGSIVFGEYVGGAMDQPFRWTSEEGIQLIPRLSEFPGPAHHLYDVNPDGSIVVGADCSDAGCRSFVWDEQHGTRDLREVLINDHGFTSQDLPILEHAAGLSADAMVVIGASRPDEFFDAWAIYLDKPLVSLGPSVLLPGDYNNNGQVEQADLDLVLLHWGADASTVPDAWTNDLPTGTIDQAELDGVLLNWGNANAAIGAASVPEPSALALLLTILFASKLFRRKRSGTPETRDDKSL